MHRHLACLLGALALAAAPLAAQSGEKPADKKPLPLATARTLTFTATRGTWMSVDVSPDGQTLVFDLLGQIYVMPATGGKATALTSGPAFNSQPRFSPDGRRIAFVSDRSGGDNVWLLSLDLKDTVQLTKGNDNLYVSPEWTPDGQYVVVSRSGGLGGGAKLWMYHVEGGNGVQLIKEPAALKTVGAAFGPDGRYIWYAQRTGDWQYNAILPQYQLAVYDRERGTATPMTNRWGSAFRPALSPDGKWLAYGTRHDAATGLRIREIATGTERWLAYPVQRDDQESRATLDVLPGYSFTADSRALVVSYGGEFWRVPVDGGAATKIPFSAEAAIALGPDVRTKYKVDDAPTFVARQVRDAVPSPDGTKLAFTALDRLYVMDWPNGTPKRLTTQDVGEYYPSWSPDGKSVAFATWKDDAGGDLMRVAASGGTPQRLTKDPAYFTDVAWAPDGKRIVALRAPARDLQEASGFFGGSPATDFVWVPAAGGAVTVIAPAAGKGKPHFTQDSSRIFAYGEGAGLVSFRWDGTDEKVHLKVTGPLPPGRTWRDDVPGADIADGTLLGAEANPQPPQADLILMAPKGDRALAQLGMDLYVVTVPQVGKDAPTVSVASLESAPVPVRKLTEIGAQFPAWAADGNRVHWAIGNAFVTYDLRRAKAVDDSIRADAKAKEAAKRAAADSAKADTTGAKPANGAAAKADSTAKDDKKEKPGYKPDERRIEVRVARDLPQGTVVLRGARVVTMKGDEVIEDADVVVTGHRIAGVGPRGSVPVPAGAEVIDASGKTIVPGFVDTHYHAQWLIPGIHPGQVWQYLTNLAYGVTTTRDPQTGTTDILSYADRVEAGGMLGPRTYSTGPGVFAGERVKDLDHARNILRRYSQYYDTKTLKMYMTGNRQQRQWIIMAAKELGLMPTTEGGLDFKLDLTHALDGYPGIEHALPITPIYGDVVKLWTESQVTNSPTLLVSYGGPFGENWWYTNTEVHDDAKLRHFTPEAELDAKTRRRGQGTGPGPGGWFRQEEYVFPRHAEFARDVVRAGGRIGIGSHGQLQGLGYHWEMWSMATGGLTPHEVLRLATLVGAEAIGFGDDLGSIEPGKLADLVVLDRNPLEDLRNTNTIRWVMKNGRLYDGGTLDERWPRRRPVPAQPWQALAPATAAGIR